MATWELWVSWETHLNNEKKPGCLGCIGDYTTQVRIPINQPVQWKVGGCSSGSYVVSLIKYNVTVYCTCFCSSCE